MMMELKEYFQQKYQGRDSFLEHVIYPVFGEENFEDGYDVSLLDDYPELVDIAKNTGISSVLRIGTVLMPFNPISIFDITVSSHVLMSRNRVGIQQLIRRIMPTFSSAFMLFHYEDADIWDWRFTFCTKAKNDEVSDKKRYTFMLGPNQSCRTIAENFEKLLAKNGNLNLQDIEQAFDVEALSDEFFTKYKWHYERFVEYVTGKRFVKSGGKWKEKVVHEPHADMYAAFGKNDKKVRDYVKKMLGRIFENLLEDNKDKGAFYTPKEIVRYMCRQSLVAYLCTNVTDSDVCKKVEEFVRTYDVDLLGGKESALAQQVDKALRQVKICDPAIGSGAFPMGLLKELFLCRGAIEDFDDAADIKRHIIQQNIYGVDYEKGAVDIARLRFWLSLVVDEKTPHTLPNLDFKIMRGNSLFECYEGVDLRGVCGTAGELTFTDNPTTRTYIRKWLEKYYQEEDHQQRLILRAKIDGAVKQLLTANNSCLEGKLDDVDIASNDRFFLWHTWFHDVFKRANGNGGFDIVIGNPPYGAKLDNLEKSLLKTLYETAKTIKNKSKQLIQKGSMDTYTMFIELAYQIMRRNGCMTMIVPISLTSSDSLEGVHRLLREKCDDIHISSYAVRPQPVFKYAVVNTSILSFRKTGKPCHGIYSTKMYRKGRNFNLQYLVDHLQFVEVKDFMLFGRIPKISLEMEKTILGKLKTCDKLGKYVRNEGAPIFYRTSGGRYFKVVTNYSTGSSKEKPIFLDEKYANAIGCILSSNLSFWYYQIYSNNLDWKGFEIENTPIPPLSDETIEKLNELYDRYLADIEANANSRKTTEGSSYTVDSFKEYKIGKSKSIIDQIDNVICPLYGLTKEETEFIKNYEIEFRLSGEE